MKVIIDSNLWIAYLDAGHPWHAIAATRVPPLAKHDLVVPTVIKMEVLHHARHGLSKVVHDWLHMDVESPALDDAIVDACFHHLQDHHQQVGARGAAILAHVERAEAKLVTADSGLAAVAKKLGLAVEHVKV